jgi:hypothetical protein
MTRTGIALIAAALIPVVTFGTYVVWLWLKAG